VEAQRVIGVDLGGTKILAGSIDGEGRVLDRREVPTPTGSQAELLEGIAAAIEPLAEAGVAALGFGIPSVIDRRTGRALGSTNIPLEDVALGQVMSERFGVPVAIENDANVAALAEWRLGAGRGADDLIMLTLGTGVGGGLVLDGALYRGWATRRAAGSISRRPAGVISKRSRPETQPIERPRSSGEKARRPSCSSAAPRKATRPRSRLSRGSATCSARRSAPSSTSPAPSS